MRLVARAVSFRRAQLPSQASDATAPMSEGEVLQRLTSAGMLIGGILTFVANAILPRAGDPESLSSSLAALSTNEMLAELGALGMAAGGWALVVGFSNIHHFIRVGAGAAWARLGFYELVIGIAALTVAEGLSLAAVEAAARSAEVPFSVAGGLLLASEMTFDISVVALWSALILVGIAWTRTDVYPKTAAWSLLALGVATTALGLGRLLIEPTITAELILAVLVGLTSVWAIMVGIWSARKAWSPQAPADAGGDGAMAAV